MRAHQKIANRDDAKTSPLHGESSHTFGLSDHDYGRVEHNGEIWLSKNHRIFMRISDLALVGTHNQYNALAAMAIADYLNIPDNIQYQVLKDFSGMPHRCQVVRTQNGVTWVNDSKATNVGATQAAIQGLGQKATRRIILIAGGRAKGAGYQQLFLS